MNSSRLIALDLETTGLDTEKDRIIEIGLLEVVNYCITDKSFERIINPGIPIPNSSSKIHGIYDKDVAGKPSFDQVIGETMGFIGSSELIIHNAGYDRTLFLNELIRHKSSEKEQFEKLKWHDTLQMARDTFPNQRNDLSSLCQRIGIETADRDETGLHDALEDARLSALVFLYFSYEKRQIKINLTEGISEKVDKNFGTQYQSSPLFELKTEELEAHRKMRKQLEAEIGRDLIINASNPLER